MRQFMQSIPTDLIEAARADGASEPRIFVSIVLPLVKPALSALAIFTLIVSWESFLWPLLVASSSELYTLPLGLGQFAGEFFTPRRTPDGGIDLDRAAIADRLPDDAAAIHRRHRHDRFEVTHEERMTDLQGGSDARDRRGAGLGIDVGGTKMSGVLIDPLGAVVARSRRPTPTG